MTHAHMAALYVIGRIMERLKNVIKDKEIRKEVKKILHEELKEVFKDFMATTVIY